MDKIICVGKNYLKHAKELGDAVPEEPLFFIKPPSTLLTVTSPGWQMTLPKNLGSVHHEVELCFRISGHVGNWRYSHYSFGLDMTLRDLQTRLKKEGQPWEKAKVFEHAAVLGEWHEMSSLKEVLEIPFTLKVNGQMRQQGVGKDMRFQPDELLLDLQKWCPLRDGDILYTGTPEGVGPVGVGDKLEISGGDISYSVTCA